MKTCTSGFRNMAKGGPGTIIQAADIYQSSCWHCHAVWMKPAKVEKTGLRCDYCDELNYYGENFDPDLEP